MNHQSTCQRKIKGKYLLLNSDKRYVDVSESEVGAWMIGDDMMMK